jgi:ABC-type dipeptide/oligopeptide/nickel transport system permease subunit
MRVNKKKKIKLYASITLLSIFAFVALFAQQLVPYDPHHSSLSLRLCSISWEHPGGCDLYGSDILSLLIMGTQNSLYIALVSNLITLITGVFFGVIAGYFGRIYDRIIMGASEIFMSFPGILLILAISSISGSSSNSIIFALCLTGWTATTRIVRAETLKLKELTYITAAKSLGASHFHIIKSHIMPALLSPLFISTAFFIASTILIESSLSYLGFGSEKSISWGALINQGKIVLQQAPHLSILPGFLIFILVFSLNTLGDALKENSDPIQ